MKAVSRLEFAPKLEEIRITDIQNGLGGFTPKPDKAVSFASLKNALKKAGYTLASAEITVTGTLAREASAWQLVVEPAQQRFALEGANLDQMLGDIVLGSRVEITGEWKTEGETANSREVIRPRSAQKVTALRRAAPPWSVKFADIQVSLDGPEAPEVSEASDVSSGMFLTPIRTTSPGLTVYRGGAFTPRYFFTEQHLGGLEIDRHTLRLNFSYTPHPKLQLEADVSYNRTSFVDGLRSGSGEGFGNLTLWGKYRFYRALETWGDRQAAVRFGLELPTGKKEAPSEDKLPAPEFVRRQLTPIAGGLSAHIDTSYSQANGRFVYGANVEGIIRSERDGFHLGHEVRINTDLEYVLLPRKYLSPANELFVILETTFVRRGRGHIGGAVAPETSATEFYLAPALQYVPSPRFLVEASVQLPVARSVGSQVLRTDRNILFGIRYLY